MKKPEDERQMARVAGWALLAIPLLLLILFAVSAWHQGLFEHRHEYRLLSASAENIKPGTPVEYAGFSIGSVSGIRLNRSGQAEVVIEIGERHLQWVRTDSIFTLHQPLLGGISIRVGTADLRNPVLPAGTVRPLRTGSAIEELRAQIIPILRDVQKISSVLVDASGDAKKTVTHLEVVSGRMATHGIVGGLTEDTAMSANVAQIAHESRLALQRLNTTLDKTDARLFGKDGLMDQSQVGLRQAVDAIVVLQEGLRGLNRVIGHGEKVAANVAEGSNGLVSLRTDVEQAMQRTDEILRRVERFLGERSRRQELP